MRMDLVVEGLNNTLEDGLDFETKTLLRALYLDYCTWLAANFGLPFRIL